jgi:hypothetical protein
LILIGARAPRRPEPGNATLNLSYSVGYVTSIRQINLAAAVVLLGERKRLSPAHLGPVRASSVLPGYERPTSQSAILRA